MTRPLRVLIVSAEVAPLASIGELGRSVSGLASALKNEGIDVRVVMPKYRNVKTNVSGLVRLVPKMRIRSVNRFGETTIYRYELPGDVPVYLIEKEKYFNRDYLYGTPEKGYPDNLERFSFFNLCALEMFTQIGFYPDVIHCHDWHTGLIPAYLRTLFLHDPLYAPITTMFTIHNLRYQEFFSREDFYMTGLPESIYHPERIEFYGRISFLKAGIVYADILSTVSKRYSQEIQTKECGLGFESIFYSRREDLYGIVNGVEYKDHDPRVDPLIAVNYTKDELEKKYLCKQDLLKQCDLHQSLDPPVIGIITSLDKQKGIDLVLHALPEMLSSNLQIILMNDGTARDQRYEEELNKIAADHGANIRYYSNYNEALKHKILAGADIFLMVPRCEPCGVLQMYSLKYGTIPLVSATGGLDDVVIDFSSESGKGNGFKLSEYSTKALLAKLKEALTVYKNDPLWKLLQANAMRADYSWIYSARKYVNLYKHAMNKTKFSPGS